MASTPRLGTILCSSPDKLARLRKTLADIKECLADMKKEYEQNGELPLTDDCQSLQRFCVKFEHLLQTGLKDRSGVLTGKKDYWDYFRDCLLGNKYLKDGLHFVKSFPELKSSLGRGRAFIRFGLVHHRLADTIQQCLICHKYNRDWYVAESFIYQRNIRDDLVSSLYELNDLKFDLAPRGYDLDSSWPSFSNKSLFGSSPWNGWRPPSRSSSITSLSSIPSLEVYSSLPARSLPVYDENYAEGAMSFENSFSGHTENSFFNDELDCSKLSDVDACNSERLSQIHESYVEEINLPIDLITDETTQKLKEEIEVLRTETDALRTVLEQEREDNFRLKTVESDLLKMETALLDQSLQWDAQRSKLLSKIADLEEHRRHDKEKYAEVTAAGDQDIQIIDGSINRFNTDHETAAETLTTCDERQHANLFQLSDVYDKLKKEDEQVHEFSEKLDIMTDAEKHELQLEVQQLTADLESARLQLSSLQLQLQERSFCDTAYQDILNDKSELEDNISNLTSELQCYADKVDELTYENSKNNMRVVELLATVTNLELENGHLTKDFSENKISLADCKHLVEELEKDKNQVSDVAQQAESDYKVEVSRLSDRVVELEETVLEKVVLCAALVSEKSDLLEKFKTVSAENEKLRTDYERLKDTVAKFEETNCDTVKLVGDLNKRIEELSVTCEASRREAVDGENKWREVVSQKELEVAGLKDDLEAMSGSVQRRERMWESARERMEQEIESVQSELSKKSSEYQIKLKSAEEHLRIVQADHEITQLQQQEELDDLKQCLGVAEHEIASLQHQVRQRNEDIQKLQTETLSSTQKLAANLNLLRTENCQLRERVVQLMKDKNTLWQKSDKLAYERRLRRSNFWHNSAEVAKCMSCQTGFTVTVRKHHCRECGRVFCWACCNNWMQTSHSNRKERMCKECVSEIQNAIMTSSTESDGTDAEHDVSSIQNSLNLTTTSHDLMPTCSDADDTNSKNGSESSEMAYTLENRGVMSRSMFESWSVRDTAQSAVTWVSSVISRGRSSSSAGTVNNVGASVKVDDSSPTVDSQAFSDGVSYPADDSPRSTQEDEQAASNLPLVEEKVSANCNDAIGAIDGMSAGLDTSSLNCISPTSATQLSRADADETVLKKEASLTERLFASSGTADQLQNLDSLACLDPAVTEEERVSETLNPAASVGDEAFDIITDEEVSQCVRYPHPIPDPKVDCAPLLRPSDPSDQSTEASHEFLVKAGRSYAVPVLIDVPDLFLVWHFTTQPKGISFSVMYKDCDIIPYRDCEDLLPSCQVNSHLQQCEGQMKAHRAGVYTLMFDNKSSRFTAKLLRYTLELKHTKQLIPGYTV